MIWRIWWLAIASLVAIFAIVIFRSFGDATGTTIPADDIGRLERIAMRPAGRVSDRALPGSITAFNAGAAE